MARKNTLPTQILSILKEHGGSIVDYKTGRVNTQIRQLLITEHRRIATPATVSATLYNMAANGLIERDTAKTKTYRVSLPIASVTTERTAISTNDAMTQVMFDFTDVIVKLGELAQSISALQGNLTKK